MLHSLQNQKYITFGFFLSEISVYLQMLRVGSSCSADASVGVL